MILKSLKLKNIRSYEQETIIFPQGRVLLSGDIGSGKSSVLLAIEFSLFGLLKGQLSGSALLRHNAKDGFVELSFLLNNEEITIRRTLKRSKDKVEQDAGFLIKNNVKLDATSIELKSKILELLGYPSDLISKSKSLIYRYTIYTPQEKMKEIIFENEEDRLSVLKKVFNIEKYQRIKENSSIIHRYLRDKKRGFELQIINLEIKRQEKKIREEELKHVSIKLNNLSIILEASRKDFENKKLQVLLIERDIKEFYELKKQLEVSKNKVDQLNNLMQKNEKEIVLLEEDISKSFDELKEYIEQDFTTQIIFKEKESNNILKEINNLQINLSGLRTQILIKEKTKNNLIDLQKCPTCFQEVIQEHKCKILDEENRGIQEIEKLIKTSEMIARDLTAKKESLNKELTDLRFNEKKHIVLRLKKSLIEEKQKNLIILKKQQESCLKEINSLNNSINTLTVKSGEKEKIAELYEQTKKIYEEALAVERKISLECAKLEENKKYSSTVIELIDKEIKEKELVAEKIKKLNSFSSWMENIFIPLTNNIEKQVMVKILQLFNEHFQTWFKMLINDESANSSINSEFAPLIQQNGYDTEIENLSGGEKTACALAYRLALNTTIHSLMSEIKTKDLLILDEPTDGFSAEQLDNVRDVLNQISAKQLILVSHESKIETFVDNIIKVFKSDGSSRILNSAN